MNSNPILEVITRGENKTVEFKEKLPKNESIAKTVIAFSNTSGGRLIIGVSDVREVIGIDEENIFELQDKIASIVFDHCAPTILPEIYTLNIGGKLLLVIEVSRGNLLPYYLKHHGRDAGVYVRLGATNRQAGIEMIHEMERQRLHQSFDEQIAWETPLSSLDLTPLQQAFAKIGKSLDAAKLHSLKLIKHAQGEDHPTHGLLIVLGAYEHVEIKCARFKGTNMAVFLDKKEYTGDVFTQLALTELFIKNHLHLKAEILGLQRTETYEIPIPAIREALVNALVHRDYSNFGRDIKVGIYDDVLNIVSPGGLPNGVTLDEVLAGRSEIRNKVVARVFKELGYIEQWGSGLGRIRQLCQAVNNPEPITKETGDFFDIEFLRILSPNVDTGLGEKLGEKLGETKARILEAITSNPKIAITQLAQHIGISTTAIENNIAQLKQARRLERIGSAKGGYWQVKAVEDE
ncbi:MAG: RNA-binding domain-containing protein [Sulfuricurvum sp.]